MEDLGLTLVDIVVFATVLVSAILAYSRGFVREVLALLCWVVAAWASVGLLDWAADLLAPLVGDPVIASSLGAGAVFLVVLIVFSLLAGRIAAVFSGTLFAPLDHSLGLVFGALRGLAIVSVLYALLSATIWTRGDCPAWAANARTLPLASYGAHVFWALVPNGLIPEGTGCSTGPVMPALNEDAVKQMSKPKREKTDSEEDGDIGYSSTERDGMDQIINLEAGGEEAR